MIYLDHSATTPVHAEVLAAMAPCWSEVFGNPSSSHAAGARAAQAVERARRQIAELLGANPHEIRFTSGGTEGDNLAVCGRWGAAGRRGYMVHSAIEHPAVREPAARLLGAQVESIPVHEDGRIDLYALSQLLDGDERPFLVSIMHASNEVGTVQPLVAAGNLCHARGVPFHIDAVQTVAQLPFDVDAMHADLVTITAHKIYGPKGIGALYVREGLALEPMVVGGGQEGGLRAGTVNVAGAVGLGAACELARRRLPEVAAMRALRDDLLAGLTARLPGLVLLGSATERLPSHLSVSIPGVDSRDLVMHLDALGLSASRGSACSAGSDAPSPTLAAMGVSRELARGALRLTLGHDTTRDEISETLDLVSTAVAALARR